LCLYATDQKEGSVVRKFQWSQLNGDLVWALEY
jgi:hypothetical protein